MKFPAKNDKNATIKDLEYDERGFKIGFTDNEVL